MRNFLKLFAIAENVEVLILVSKRYIILAVIFVAELYFNNNASLLNSSSDRIKTMKNSK